jgi:hypothetical protein
MQLRKPLAQRCAVDQSAMDLMLRIVDCKWKQLEELYKVRDSLFEADIKLAATIKPLAHHETDAVELLRANMLGLSYASVEAISYNDKSYLHAITRPVVATETGSRAVKINRHKWGEEAAKERYWDIGIYDVYIPGFAFLDRTFDKVHLIPQREPMARNRHFHHIAYAAGETISNPLQMIPHWCAASFATIFSNLLGDLDFPGYLKIIGMFLKHFNRNSPLSSTLSFAKEVK